jgi:hypothetical protein
MSVKSARQGRLKPLTIDVGATIAFLRSVSYAVVAQRTTQLVWHDDETPLRYLYSAFLGAFGKPGTVEMQTATESRMRQEVEVETHHRIDVLMHKVQAGPTAVAEYLASLHEIRAFCLEAIRDQYKSANEINRGIAAELGRSIERLANIELAATITVKVAGQVPGPGWLVSLGYDVVDGAIEDLSKAPEANSVVMVIAQQSAKEGAKEIAGQSAEKLVDTLNRGATEKELTHALTRMRQLEDKLDRQTRVLAQRTSDYSRGMTGPGVQDSIRSLEKQVVRNSAKLDNAQKGVLKAGGKAAIAKAVSWVFLANDVMEAVKKRDATISAARQ